MRIYDFSIYAQRRKERNAAMAVAEIIVDIEKPGSVIHLKTCVSNWFVLHQEVMRQARVS